MKILLEASNITVEFIPHGKNGFAEWFKILAGYRSEKWFCWIIKIIMESNQLLEYQNFLQYCPLFSNKIIFRSVSNKILDTSAKLFFLCTYHLQFAIILPQHPPFEMSAAIDVRDMVRYIGSFLNRIRSAELIRNGANQSKRPSSFSESGTNFWSHRNGVMVAHLRGTSAYDNASTIWLSFVHAFRMTGSKQQLRVLLRINTVKGCGMSTVSRSFPDDPRLPHYSYLFLLLFLSCSHILCVSPFFVSFSFSSYIRAFLSGHARFPHSLFALVQSAARLFSLALLACQHFSRR